MMLFAGIGGCAAFQLTPIHFAPMPTSMQKTALPPTAYPACQPMRHHGASNSILRSKNIDDEDEDDDDYIDDDSLGDWRSFRNTLVESGISSPSIIEEEGYVSDESKKADEESITKKNTPKKPKSVSKENEDLLMSQNKKLAREYKDGVWAHETPDFETGGLVVRLPLEAEIYRMSDTTLIGRKLQSRLEIDDGRSNSESVFSSTKEQGTSQSFSLAAAKTIMWYKRASAMIDEYMQTVASAANENGEVDPNNLKQDSLDLLNLYLDNQERWQEVCLVTNRDVSKGSATTLVINRPMAFQLSQSMARLVLFGAMSAISDKSVKVSETQSLVKFLNAFGDKCAIYVGGKDHMDRPATMIHGIEGLEGSEEISPGTKIYKGGLEAAIDGIMAGKYNPLDFRFFVGCNEYVDGELDTEVYAHKYQPVACARSVVLKQCIQLPKPLWHEVIELCGGEYVELSNLELMKRADL